MKNKFDKDEIIFGIIILITFVISIFIGNKIGVQSKLVFATFGVIEFGLFCLIEKILDTKRGDNSNLTKGEEEIYKNPMQDRFNKCVITVTS